MRILQVAEALHPKWGGVAEGAYQQSIELLKRGHQVEALSCEEDEVPRLAEAGIVHHRFDSAGHKWRKNPQTDLWVDQNINNFDAVILNGLWMHPIWTAGRAARKAGVDYWVMTHGMLDPWFLRGLKKKVIKRIYWALYEGKTIKGCRGVLFTTEAELELARANYPLESQAHHVVGYGITDPTYGHPQPVSDSKSLLFMSRIHPKKGLEMLFEAMRGRPGISLEVAGTGDQVYTDDLKASSQDISERVKWLGFTSGNLKNEALQKCGAMVLPSHQENFGIIVVEALAFGRPVLMTDKVNTWHEVDKANAGIVAEDTDSGIGQLLDHWEALSSEKQIEMGQAARRCFEENFTIEAHVDKLLKAIST